MKEEIFAWCGLMQQNIKRDMDECLNCGNKKFVRLLPVDLYECKKCQFLHNPDWTEFKG
mgnify:CR=1 FL=1